MAHRIFEIEELIEHILKFTNGLTLAHAEKVCVLWKSVVDRLDKNYNIWKLCCEKEMSEDTLFDLLTILYPKYFLAEHEKNICWKSVYKHWKQWKKITEYVYVIRNLSAPWNLKTGIDLFTLKCSGDWMFISTRFYLVIYNPKKNLMKTVKTNGTVVDLQPYVKNVHEDIKDIYLSSLFNEDKLERFKHDAVQMYIEGHGVPYCLNFDLHTGTLKTLPYNTIGLFFQNKCVHPCTELMNINSPERKAVIRDLFTVSDPTPVSWGIENSDFPLQLYVGGGFVFDTNDEKLVNYWKDKLCILYHFTFGQVLRYLEKNEAKSKHANIETYSTVESVCLFNQIHNNINSIVYNWHCKVTVCVFDDFTNIIVCSKFETYYPIREISSNITAVLFYIDMLFLGTSFGNIYMYRVSDLEDLLRLDLKKPTWFTQVYKSAIKGIEIMETQPRPTIICRTGKNIYNIEFLSVK